MKCKLCHSWSGNSGSPSVWREWIEIPQSLRFPLLVQGSPSVWREWIEIYYTCIAKSCKTSPSVWREWIEIKTLELNDVLLQVSLRVEGVD